LQQQPRPGCCNLPKSAGQSRQKAPRILICVGDLQGRRRARSPLRGDAADFKAGGPMQQTSPGWGDLIKVRPRTTNTQISRGRTAFISDHNGDAHAERAVEGL